MLVTLLSLLGSSVSARACDPYLTKTTLDHYNVRAEEYLKRHDRTTDTIQRLYGTFLSLLPQNKRPEDTVVVDLGAGHGRETLQFRRDDIEVIPVEPANELAKMIEQRSGVPVWRQLAQKLDLGQQVDGVWAMASLIHVPVEELPKALERIKWHLRMGGVLFISICFNVGTPNVGEIDAKGRYFNRITPERWRELVAQVGGFEVIEQHTGVQRDDFHGKDKPSSDFSFFNLFVRRVPEPNKVQVASTKIGLEATLGKNTLTAVRNIKLGEPFLEQTFFGQARGASSKVTWSYRLTRVDRDGDQGGQTFAFEVASGARTRHWVTYVKQKADGTLTINEVWAMPRAQLTPDPSTDPTGEMAAFRERVLRRVMESDGRTAIP